MKNFKTLIALTCSLFVLWGCPKPGPDNPDNPTPVDTDPVLEAISATEYPEIGSEGGEFTIKCKSDAEKVEARSNVSWITVTPGTRAVTTKTITIVVQANTTPDSRNGKVTVTAGKSTLEFNIKQAGVTPEINVAITEYPVPAEGGTVNVNVTSNVSYHVDIDVDWIKQEGDAFIVEANDVESERSGKITFSYGELSKSVTVKQDAKEHVPEPYINAGGGPFSVAAAGGSVTVTVESNVEYETVIGADWVTGKVPTFTVAANPSTAERSTTVTFKYEDITKSVTITQAGKPEDPYINVDPVVVEVPSAGETFPLNVSSNVAYETSVDATWVTVSGTSVRVAENKEYTPRSATITFSYGEVKATVAINQKAAIEPDVLEYVGNDPNFYVSAEGATISVKIRTNVNYTTTPSANWITEATTRAIREDEKIFIVAENDGEAREATITFSYANLTSVVTVHQAKKPNTEQPYIVVVQKTYSVPAAGGTFPVDVTSNVEYETELGADWVAMSGKTMTVAENTAYESRSTTVTFKYQGLSETITVNQEAAIEPDVLEFVTEPALTVPAEGGDVSFKISTNGTPEVTTSASWLVQVETRAASEETLTFRAAANEGDARTASIFITLGEITLTTIVSQEAYVPPTPPDEPYLTIDPTSIEMPEEGGVVDVTVNTNCEEVTVLNGADWITETQIDGGYRFTIAANTGATVRSVEIYFMADDLDDVVFTVSQAEHVDDTDPFDVGPNLSVNGTANSYVVTKPGRFTFDASVMGNGPDGFLWDEARAQDSFLWPKGANLTTFASRTGSDWDPKNAFVLWDEGGVVSSVTYDKEAKTISFTATGNKGAALIGLFNKFATKATCKDDEALWSWMIWCTDSPKHYIHYDIDDSENAYYLMDRNLGATSADPAAGTATYGYYFQFGRPTPLRAYVGMAKDFSPLPATMFDGITHPCRVPEGGHPTNNWYYNELVHIIADLWGNPRHKNAVYGEGAIDSHPQAARKNELKKTIYDPCPPGYIVPPEITWQLAGLEDDLEYPITFTEDGAFIQAENGQSFYPFAGYISCLQSGEGVNKSRLGWLGFKGWRDVLPPEDNNITELQYSGTHNCGDYRTQASVYTSCTGPSAWYFEDSNQWNLYGAYFLYLSPDGSIREQSGNIFGSIRQKAFPVRCVKEFK